MNYVNYNNHDGIYWPIGLNQIITNKHAQQQPYVFAFQNELQPSPWSSKGDHSLNIELIAKSFFSFGRLN